MTLTENKNVHEFHLHGRRFILLGTAHVSKESAAMTEQVIRDVAPDTICVELCEPRYQALQNQDRWRDTDIVDVIRSGRMYVLMAQLALASFQKRLADQFGIRPGEEMHTAIRLSNELHTGLLVVDRDVKITLRRAWSKASLWSMLKVIFSLFGSAFSTHNITEEDIEKLKTGDALADVMFEFGQFLPGIKEVLIDERDQYMAAKIFEAPGQTVVAVLGAGHIPGISRLLGTAIETAPLEEVPPPSLAMKTITWGIPLAIIAIITAGFMFSGIDTSMEMIVAWVLANGVLSAIGALIALAHPLTVVTAFFAAPITSLNPTISAGTVCGFVEAWLRKPLVRDFETIADDINSLPGLWRNRLGRIMLVFLLSSLGSAIGTFVGAGWIVSILQGA